MAHTKESYVSQRGTNRSMPRLILSILAGEKPADIDVVDAVSAGISSNALDYFTKAGLSMDEIARVIGVSARTLHRKRALAAPLDVAESDRAVRLAKLIADAERYIGDRARGLNWLRSKNWALADRIPLDLAATEPGVDMVRQAMMTVAFGGVA